MNQQDSTVIDLSIIKAYPTVKEALQDIFQLSNSKIKRSAISKNFLKKNVLKGDQLSIPIDLVNDGKINSSYIGPSVDIIFEDENYLVMNKPAGIHGHPLSYGDQKNLLSYLRSIGRGDLLEVNQQLHERGLLYRLDSVTSGVLFYLKKEELYHQLRDNFSEVMKEKIYLAIVHGKCVADGEHTTWIRATGSKGSKMVSCQQSEGEQAQSIIKTVDYNEKEDLTLVKISLLTGLRHQIRLQLSDLGYPIMGDSLYGGQVADRVFLHCYRYTIDDSGEFRTVVSKNLDLFETFFDLDRCLQVV